MGLLGFRVFRIFRIFRVFRVSRVIRVIRVVRAIRVDYNWVVSYYRWDKRHQDGRNPTVGSKDY